MESLCLYWNSRATREAIRHIKGLGRRSLLFPKILFDSDSAIENLLQIIKRHISYHNISTNHTIQSNIDIAFAVEEEIKTEIIGKIENINNLELAQEKDLNVTHSYRTAGWYEATGEPEPEMKPQNEKLVYKLGVGINSGTYKLGFTNRIQQITSFVEGENKLLFPPPVKFNNQWGQEIILDIESEIWKRFPDQRKVAKSITSEGWFSQYGLSKIAQINSYPHQNLILNIPTEWDAITLFFENKGYAIKSTETSKYSEALINVMGGLRTVTAITAKTVYRLLELLEAQSTKKLAQKLRKELGIEKRFSEDETITLLQNFEIDSDIFRGAKPFSDLIGESKINRNELLQILQKLCELSVIKRGFRLDCPRCGTSDWYPLENIGEHLVCTGCSHRFMLPVSKGDSEISWHYRLSSLANRAMDQDILPAIYALYHLTKDIEASCMNLGLEVRKQGETNAITDFDFLYVSNQKIYAGECKKGTELGEKDLDTATFAAQLGFAKFYFCTVNTFSEKTIRKIEERKVKIKEDGFDMTIEVLSESELLTN